MKLYARLLCGVFGGLLLINSQALPALGADAYHVFTDPNADGLAFGVTDAFAFGNSYSINTNATLNGNQVLSISQFGIAAGATGAGVSVPISNGENGINQSLDGAANEVTNLDAPNTTPANGVFTAIGNASNKLENGNVIRFSAWFRSDPANPITVDPQIQPVLKVEIWKEALSGQTPEESDTNPNQLQPLYGDKVFDQDQHGGTIGIPDVDQPQWIDFNGDGMVIDGSASAEGRVSLITTSAWTLVESQYTITDSQWLGIGDDVYDVTEIEEVRAVMFVGDFANTNLSGDGNGGNFLVDNVLVEVFKNAAAVTANTNPNPDLLLGDYNGNNVVDAADYVVWRNGGPLLNEGASRGGIIDVEDYKFWRSHFGDSIPGPGLGSATVVPEPTSCALALLATFAACLYSRRCESVA